MEAWNCPPRGACGADGESAGNGQFWAKKLQAMRKNKRYFKGRCRRPAPGGAEAAFLADFRFLLSRR